MGWLVSTLLACGEPAPPVAPDPATTDSDSDRLSDADEVALGTDPEAFDSDDDSYGDGDEVATGHDPLDRKDRIYENFWPYNHAKDELADPGFDGSPVEVGERFGRVRGALDPAGQEVDLYDFANGAEWIVIDASAMWCGPCQVTSSWISGGPDEFEYEFFYADARAALDDGRFWWVTFLTDGLSGPAGLDDAIAWDEAYPHRNVAVLTDPDGQVFEAMNLAYPNGSPEPFFPSFVVVDREMNVVVRGQTWDAMDHITAWLAAETP